nr:DUF3139 domain-containing protein [Lysinibacillus sp. BF-4]
MVGAVLIFMIVLSVLFFSMFFEKKNAADHVNHYLQEQGYTDKIERKMMTYRNDEKKYYMRVRFKDEPTYMYYYHYDKKTKVISAFILENSEHVTDGKYLP